MLPATSTALSTASRSKTSSPRPENPRRRDILRTGLPRHSARSRHGSVWSTFLGSPRASGIGADPAATRAITECEGLAPLRPLTKASAARTATSRSKEPRNLADLHLYEE